MPREKMTLEQRERLCELLELAMEGRSYAEYAEAARVSASNISRIKRSEYRPHPDILKKLTSPEARPANNITYRMLRQAVGYEDEEGWEKSPNTETGSVSVVAEESMYITNTIRACREEGHYDVKCLGIICGTLFNLGFNFLNIRNRKEIGLTYLRPDIMMSVPEKGMFWLIENMTFPGTRLLNVERYLSNCIFEAANPKIKMSIVVSESDLFEQTILKYKDRIPYRGDLSIILMNFREDKVVKETYLSHYYEEEKKQKKTEFYIDGTNDSKS